MNSSAGNRANSQRKSATKAPIFSLNVARRMLPLVRQIVEDLLHFGNELNRLQPEQDRLDRNRRELAWPERSRRYQLHDEIAAVELQARRAIAELGELQVALLDPETGRVGFLTAVNGNPAYFSWQPPEEGIHFWHFDGETVRRPIPLTWAKEPEVRLSGRRKKG